MNAYEQKQIAAIEHWKAQEPGMASQAFDTVTAPATWLASKLIPIVLVQKVLETADRVARNTVNDTDILHDGKVSSIGELRHKSLRISDKLANDVASWALATAWASGSIIGGTGFGGVTLDISALITLALRTVHKTALCYGYDQLTEQQVLGILTISSAANRKEKINSVHVFHELETMALQEVWEDAAKDAVLTRIARSGMFFSARRTSKHLGRSLAKRKSLQVFPLAGAVISGATNVSFLSDVSETAKRVFQERWLMENGKLKSGEQKMAASDKSKIARI